MADKRQLVIDKVEVVKRFLFNNTKITNGTDVVEFRYFLNNYTDCIVIKVFFGRDIIYREEYSFDDFLATPVCVLANHIIETRDHLREGENNRRVVKIKDAQGNWKDVLDYELYKHILSSTYGIPKNNSIKKVIFNPPATIVFWKDGTKTVVKSDKEDFDKEKGLAMAISKKALGNKGNYYNEIKKWIGE